MTVGVLLLVMLGGALGALARFGAVHLTRRTRFPWAILVVNAVGSFVCGIAVGGASALGHDWSLILASGFCGGFTTFSTFAVDTVRLGQEGRHRAAFGNAILNLGLGIGAAALGVGVGLTIA